MNSFGTDAFNRQFNFNNTYLPTRYDTSKRATMYLCTPRQVPDVVVRPYQYNFDAKFCTDFCDIVQQSASGMNNLVGGHGYIASRMPGMSSANNAMAPSASGQVFSGRYYGDLWTCIVILDNVSFEGRHNPVDLNNRLLYFGFCLDEPVVQSAHGMVFNENCSIMFTHVTHLDIATTISSSGQHVRSNPIYDVDIVHPQQVMQCSQNREYFLRPQDLVSDITYDSNGQNFYEMENTYLGNKEYGERVSTILNNPKEQLSNIVDGITKSVASKNQMSNTLSFGLDDAYDDDFTWMNTIKSNMTEHSLSDRYIGLPVNMPLMLGDIIRSYPTIQNNSQVLEFPWELQCPVLDTRAPNPINIWSSLLMSAVPSVMANFGISDVSFRYDSINQNGYSVMDRGPIYEVYELQTFVPEENDQFIKTRWNNALQYLQDNIFPIIIEQAGNFSASIQYSSSKECSVMLNLIDMYNTVNDGVMVTNALYGGLQSPIVGSKDLKESNTKELTGIAQLAASPMMA